MVGDSVLVIAVIAFVELEGTVIDLKPRAPCDEVVSAA